MSDIFRFSCAQSPQVGQSTDGDRFPVAGDDPARRASPTRPASSGDGSLPDPLESGAVSGPRVLVHPRALPNTVRAVNDVAKATLADQSAQAIARATERLYANLREVESGCVEWTGYRDKAGYGHMRIGSQIKMRPHRFMWELANGTIPEGMVVRHRCDNRACCRLDHLELGSQADNIQDMRDRGRERKAKGYAHPRSVGPEVEAAIVARWDRRKVLQTDLASEFGIQRSTVQRILRRHGR
jgi:hypothetical protein